MAPGCTTTGSRPAPRPWPQWSTVLGQTAMPRRPRVFTFFSQYGEVNYGQLSAYSLIYTLPVLMLYLLLSKRLGGAFALGGAIKG
jgi:multiple sugar transport system permease protein